MSSSDHVCMCYFFYLNQAETGPPHNTTTTSNPGTGTKKKTTDGTNVVLPREVMLHPSITPANLEKKYPMLPYGISIRIILHRLQMDLNLSHVMQLITPIMKKRLQFCNDYVHWTSASYKTVMFSDESTMIRQRRVQDSQEASRVINI